jgi:hypothetical protein
MESYIEVTGTNQNATQDTDAKKLETAQLTNSDGTIVHREGVFIGSQSAHGLGFRDRKTVFA